MPLPFTFSATIKSAILTVLIGVFGQGTVLAQGMENARPLPAHFSANRIYVHPVTASGDTLRLYTDTGGGNVLVTPTVERLGLSTPDTAVIRGRSVPIAEWPDFRPETAVPPPSEQRVYVFPADGQAERIDVGDGMLGRSWFSGHVWTFDYARKQLLLHTSDDDVSFDPSHTVPLGLKTDSTGRRVEHFPSVEAIIDGETYSFLFDTGASMVLSDSAHAARGGPPVRGTSFITASLFDQWREAHPDWPVLENTAISGPVIEVPKITIAGHTVGPVRFVRRPDRAFHQQMSSMMDRRVEGALGGSLFRYFVITVDYPNARAHFQQTSP